MYKSLDKFACECEAETVLIPGWGDLCGVCNKAPSSWPCSFVNNSTRRKEVILIY